MTTSAPLPTRAPASRSWLVWSQLTYSLFVFVQPAVAGGNARDWILAVASLVVFTILYFDFIASSARPTRRTLVEPAMMAALGLLLAPLNPGALTYVVYAAALAPMVLTPRASLTMFAVMAAAVAAEMILSSGADRFEIGGWVIFLIFIVGGGNLFVGDRERQNALIRQAREDVEEMAKVAERERIARDLHDVLGHTLSVIAVKSELAARLADVNPARAAQEIRDVEHVSRQALTEVRAAVEGYKGRGFMGELKDAADTLRSAGVRLDADVEEMPLSPRQETILALALRETVTNIVRHAKASVCTVALGADNDTLLLSIQDDGIGGPLREGNGLTGMRQRVTMAGGRLDVDAARGVSVRIRLPRSREAAS